MPRENGDEIAALVKAFNLLQVFLPEVPRATISKRPNLPGCRAPSAGTSMAASGRVMGLCRIGSRVATGPIVSCSHQRIDLGPEECVLAGVPRRRRCELSQTRVRAAEGQQALGLEFAVRLQRSATSKHLNAVAEIYLDSAGAPR